MDAATSGIYFDAGDHICLKNSGANVATSTAVYRDPSAWYHILVASNGTQSTVYINNSSSTVAYWLGTLSSFNTAILHNIGRSTDVTRYTDGYLTEINFIDGQALTPSSFGGYNSVTGGWEARKYTGTYGANGFYLNFSDNSAATAAAIGKDSSGNGNNWTPNNISVTAGVTYDSMLDVPTMWSDGGNGRGNYCTWNPLDKGGGIAISNANLDTSNGAAYSGVRGTMAIPSTGKWYFEYKENSTRQINNIGSFGITYISTDLGTNLSSSVAGAYWGLSGLAFGGTGTGNTSGWTTPGIGSGDIVQLAVDADSGNYWLGINNVWYRYSGGKLLDGSPSTGTNQTGTLLANQVWWPCVGSYATNGNVNFGQRPFSYTPPSGFKALHTGNLPAPAIAKPNKNFDVSLYTGNGTSQSITNTGGFAPDLVWAKGRDYADYHVLVDSIRGATVALSSNLTNAEVVRTVAITSLNTNGFSLGADTLLNYSTHPAVAWQWKAGGTAVSNNSGTIVSQVSANASAGFSVVTYTGTGVNGATVGHGLGVAPKMMIVKGRNNAVGWSVYHTSIGATGELLLNSTAATATHVNYWNNTSPTSSTFSIGIDGGVNNSTWTYVAYCFSEIAGYSKMGSYTANASVDGPFVYTGFRPKFVMIKASGLVQEWVMMDTSRDPSNVANRYLLPNSAAVEGSGGDFIDFLSNGFKIRDSGSGVNYSAGQNYIYIAFAETPFKNALAR
jgi:hypothetical protein